MTETGQTKFSSFLQEAFALHGTCEFFKGITYRDYLAQIRDNYESWSQYEIAKADLVVLSDHKTAANLLDILTALYYGHRICMIHNKMFLEHALEQLSVFGTPRLLADGRPAAIIRCKEAPPADLIASTSGTTGLPNLVQHKADGILANIAAIETYLHPEKGDVIYLQRNPIYLSVLTGEVLLAIKRGCCIFIPENTLNPEKLITDLRDQKAAVLVSVMSYFDTILPFLKRNADALQSLKYLQFVGEGGRIGLISELAAILPDTDVIIGYGLTESGPRISYASCRKADMKQYLVGTLLPGVRARIVSDTGEILPCGEKGTVELSSPSMMIGYVGKDSVQEWFRTSDFGWIDENGSLYIQGRLDDIAIRNGVKVPLVTIEQALMQSGMISCACAFTVTGKKGNIRVEAAVLAEQPADDLESSLMKWCRTNLDDILWPQKIYRLDSFPHKPNGKLDRRAIQAAAAGA